MLTSSINRSNWFTSSKTPKNILWHGNFKCINSSCTTNFKAAVYSDIEKYKPVEIEVKLNNFKLHEKVDKYDRIVGENRKFMAQKIISNGLQNFKAENIIDNRNNNECN